LQTQVNASSRLIRVEATNAKPRLQASEAAYEETNQAADDGSEAGWLARNSAIVLAGAFASQGFQFVTQVVLARLLGPADFGLYGIGFTLLRLVGPFATLGLNSGVIYGASVGDQSDAGRKRDVLLQSLLLGLLAGGAIGAVACLGARWISAGVFGKVELTGVIRAFSLALPLLTGLTVAVAATRLSLSMVYSTCTETTQSGLNLLLLAIVLYFLNWRLMGAIAVTVVSLAVALLLALYFIFRLFRQALGSQAKMRSYIGELLAFSLPTSIAGAFTYLIARVDRLMVGAFLPAAQVGIYQAASQASIVFAIIPFIFNNVIAPRVSDLYARGEINRLDELFKLGAKWSFYLAMPLFLAVCAAPGGFMQVLYGLPYRSGAWPLLILCAGLMSDAVVGAAPTILIFSGHQKFMGLISAAALVSTIVLNYLLVPRFGMIGGAVSAFLPEVGMLFGFLLAVKNLIGIWPYDRRWIKGIGAVLSTIAGLWLLRIWMGQSAELAPVPNVIVAEVVFWAVLLLSGLDPEDKNFLSRKQA
jgi:O-antigen/teichoic acid export membrane protein